METDKLDAGYQPGVTVQNSTPQQTQQEPWAVQVKKQDETVYKLGIAPETKKQSFVEYVSADPASRSPLSAVLSNINENALAQGRPIEETPTGQNYVKENDKWLYNRYTPQRIAEIKKMGPIGFFEAPKYIWKQGIEDVIPGFIADGIDTGKSLNILRIINKAKKNPNQITPQEQKTLDDYLDTEAQIQLRGFSIGGAIVYGGAKVPKYGAEFSAILATMGGYGILKAGTETTGIVAKKALKEVLKEGVQNTGKMLAVGAKMTLAPTTLKTAPLIYGRIAHNVTNQYLNESVAITDKGQAYFKDAQLSPFKALWKAVGSTWVENSSELAGSFLFKPFSHQVGARLPKGFLGKWNIESQKHLGVTITQGIAKWGYDGYLEEMGEERLAAIGNVALGLEGDITTEKLATALFPYFKHPDQFFVESGIIAIHGTASASVLKLTEKLSKGKTKEDVAETFKHVETLSEKERESLLNQIENKETEKDVQEYTQKIQDFKDMVGENIPRETLDANIAIWDNMINVLANKTGKTRSELADELPIVKSMKQGEMTGLFQNELNNYGIQPELFFKRKEIEDKLVVAESKLKAITEGVKLDSGGVPDEIRNTPEYKKAKSEFDKVFVEQQNFNMSADGKALQKSIQKLDRIQRQKLIRGELFQSELKENIYKQGAKGAFNAKNNIIALFETADRSTFLHESAHAFFEMYLKHLPNELNPVLKWAGFEGKKIEDLTDKQYVKLQESFASGFELYLREGKAPSSQLADAFERFKEFLNDIYKTVQDLIDSAGFDIKLNDDIRAFYDEMLSVPEDMALTIDETIKPDDLTKERDITLFQEAKKKLEEVKKKKAQLIKKYGQEAKIELETLNQDIDALETMLGKKSMKVIREAETVFNDMPISQVFDGKIRVTDENKEMFDRYDVPKSVRSTDEAVKTLDEWATDLEMTEEQVLEEVAKIGSKTQFIDNYISKNQEQVAEQMQGEDPLDVKIKKIQEKLKEDAKAGSVTTLQAEVIKAIRDLNIDDADKVKFLGMIQKAKTPYSQKKVMMEMLDREQAYWEKQQRNLLDTRIKKLLKQTKPKTQAGITKGKYEYEFNKLFEELRDIEKLTKEEAKVKLSMEIESQDQEGVDLTSELKLKRLILSWKAYGKSDATLEVFQQAYSQLQNAIAIAKESKDEKDFIEKINLSDKKNSVLEAIKVMKFKGDRDNASTKALNIYRVMFADLYGQLNSIAGKDVAEEYALDVKEKDKQSELESFRDEMYLDIQNILNVKDKYEVEKYFDKLNKKEFKLFEIGRLKGKDITRWEIIDIYNSIKNEKTREHYYKYYGQEQVDSLVSNLTDREIAIANYLQERVQEMYGIVNQIHIKQFGIDLGRVENYWPRKSEQSEKEPYQEYRQATQISSAQKARAEGAIPLPQNAYLVASKHFDNAIHQKNLFDVWYNARKVFGSRRVRTAIEDKYGADVHRKLIESIDDVSFNSNNVVLDKASQIVMKALSNWTGAKILLNASLVPKQFIGAFNFLEQVPAQHFTKYFIEGLLNPKKTIDYMFEKSKYVPARFKQGADDIMQNVMKNGGNVAKSRKFTDYMSFFIRTGDAGAVVFGGYAHVKYLMDVKGMSEAEAIQEFEKQTIRTQQAGFKTSLAGYQKIPGMKFFTAFKNAQTQMMRRVVNAFIQYQQGDIDKKQLAKVFTLYVIVQPALFGMVSVAWREIVMGKGGDDEDRYLDAAFENIFTNALAPVPLVADASGNIYKTISASLKGETVPFWAKQTSTPLITDLNKLTYTTSGIVGNLLTGEDPDFEDVLKMLELGAEIGYGLPVGNVVRQTQGILRLE